VLPPVSSRLPWSTCVLSLCADGSVGLSCLAGGLTQRVFRGWSSGLPAQVAWSTSRSVIMTKAEGGPEGGGRREGTRAVAAQQWPCCLGFFAGEDELQARTPKVAVQHIPLQLCHQRSPTTATSSMSISALLWLGSGHHLAAALLVDA